jgi:hypothetical protein
MEPEDPFGRLQLLQNSLLAGHRNISRGNVGREIRSSVQVEMEAVEGLQVLPLIGSSNILLILL